MRSTERSRVTAWSCSPGFTGRDGTCCESTRRDDPRNPLRGVFGTRSADRPNPTGLHEVEIVAIEGDRVRVRPLEAVDGTPILDLKPVI